MSIQADLRRLGVILERLAGEQKLRDEAKAIVCRMITAQAREGTTTEWWATYGTNKPVSDSIRRVIDFSVINDGATTKELAAHLGVDEETAYRYVSRADDQLLDRGGKATISFDGTGVARTATTSIIVSNISPR
jgi:uncharacterized protein YidB (DUF937 family)